MATYIKSLKEDNGDIILPQTSADAVLASDDTTVQSKLDNYATVNKTTSTATSATNCVLKDASGNELHPTTDFTQVNGTVPTAKIAPYAVTSAKLASSAVTTAKIADSAVTSAKIDWTTLTDNSSYFYIGNILVQFGIASGMSYNTTKTITLPKAFGNTSYSVVLTTIYDEKGGSFWWAFVTGKNSGSFTARAGYKGMTETAGGGTNVFASWIAIGIKAS